MFFFYDKYALLLVYKEILLVLESERLSIQTEFFNTKTFYLYNNWGIFHHTVYGFFGKKNWIFFSADIP